MRREKHRLYRYETIAGGAIEDGTLALRYVCSNPDVTVVIPEWQKSVNWRNYAACSNTDHLPTKNSKMDKVREQLGTDFCRAATTARHVL